MPTSPVLELQTQSGATVGEAHGWRLPSAYSNLVDEYEAATSSVGLVDRSYIGRLKLAGEEALDLLNRLSTNDLELLTEAGQGMHTVLTSNKGRIIDLLFVLRQDDHLLVLTAPETRQKVADWIDFYTFAEDVAVHDVTEETAMLAVTGPNAAPLLDEITGQKVSSLTPHDSLSFSIDNVEVTLVRTDFIGLPGYDMTIPASQAQRLWTQLLEKGEELGIRPVGIEALEVVRVEQGVPLYGKELSEDVNPLEANLLEFISFNKGCYVGQEVVTRLNTYDKVQRHLVGLSWESDEMPASNAGLLLDGKRVGSVTSAVRSPRLNKSIGLGFVRKPQTLPGVLLTMEMAEIQEEVRAEELPFQATAG